ncbi:MAG: type II secretion system protein [Candidatus Omnitrophica bacterium]|nr:type II secretion system protein [Candidatus Omnitrophota bacterium]
MNNQINFRLKSPRAITLTELLVASVLIGIVMLGVITFSFTVKNIQVSTQRSSSLSAKIASAMSYLRQDAYSAVGYFDPGWSEPNNPPGISAGVYKGFTAPTNSSICFRHDTDGDPSLFTTDQWRCYFAQSGGPSIDGNLLCGPEGFLLWRCPLDAVVAPTADQGRCLNGDSGALESAEPLLCITAQDEYAGSSRENVFFHISFDADGKLQYIELTLKAKYDTRLKSNPLTNPEYVMKSRVNPPQSSR